MPDSWSVHEWSAHGGYSNEARDGDNGNKTRERIWFSPHCLGATDHAGAQVALLGAAGAKP